MTLLIVQLAAVAIFTIPTTVAQAFPDTSEQHGGVNNIRLPPTINPTVDTSPPAWDPMPPGWWYGEWYVAHSSNKKYQAPD